MGSEQTPVVTLSTKKGLDFSTTTVLVLTALLFVGLSLTSNTFLRYDNIYSILYGVSFQFLAVIGFTFLLIMGEIDLSVGSVYAFSGMFVGFMTIKLDVPLPLAVLISLAVCAGMGLLTGLLIVKLHLNSMMVTIATMTLIFGLASNFVKKLSGATYPQAMRALPKAGVGGIHWTVIAMILLVVGLELLLRRSTLFRKMYFVGESEETARIYGIKSGKIKVLVFGVSSLTAALGGILANARVTYADASLGLGLEFTLLTAAVLGGASLYGGKGSVLSSCVGLIFLATISNGMVIFDINPLLSQIIVGIILVVSVFVDRRFNRNG